jgi:hypothetical protein
MLDDEDPGLRQVAYGALQIADGVGFDYRPDTAKAKRKMSVECWNEWCRKTCGERIVEGPAQAGDGSGHGDGGKGHEGGH